MRAGPLTLTPLRSLQSLMVLRLELLGSRVTLSHRDSSSEPVLARLLVVVVLLVTCQSQAAAEALLLLLRLLRVGGRRLRLVRPAARLVVAGRDWRAALELLEVLRVEREVGRMSVASGTLGKLLSISGRGNTGGYLLHWRLLSLRNLLSALR